LGKPGEPGTRRTGKNRFRQERFKNAKRLVDDTKLPRDRSDDLPEGSGFAGTRKRGNNGIENEGAIFAERFAGRHQRSFRRKQIPMNHRTVRRVQRVVRG